MAFKLADRVRETTTTTGTGSVALGGAVTGYQTFSAGIGASNTTYYVIADQTGSNWEVGYGTLDGTAANLARTTVLASSNSGSLVNFTSGTKDVFCDYPATQSVNKDSSGNVTGYAISGGTIDNTVIGGTTPAAGTFTTITGQTEVLKGTGTNLFTQSSVLTNAVWTQTGVTLTGSQTDVFGGTTASLMNDGTSAGLHYLASANVTVTSASYTYSIYAKAGTANYVGIYSSLVNQGAFFNLTTGAFTSNILNAPASYTSSNTGLASGWWRLSITVSSTAGTESIRIFMSEDGTNYSFTGTSKTITASSPQAEIGSTLNTYVPTTSAAIYGTPTLSFSGVAGLGLQSDGSLYVSPAGTGALQAQATTSSTVGGNARGANAVDWQTSRGFAANVASGAYSVLGGGYSSTASGSVSGVFAGNACQATNFNSAVLGGTVNIASGINSGVVTGNTNTASGYYGFVGTGFTNSTTSNSAVTTQSGTMNGTTAVTLSGSNASIKVGQYITGTSISNDTYVAAISGTSLTLSKVASGSSTSTLSFYTPHGVVVGGGNNQATGSYSFIGGGGDAGTAANRNVASGDYAVVVGGRNNVASSIGAFVGGGGTVGNNNTFANTASNTAASVVGGIQNTASGLYSFVGGGYANQATGAQCSVAGGTGNFANGSTSAIIGGAYGTTRNLTGYHVFPACVAPLSTTAGQSQAALLILAKQTTDATATVITSDGGAASGTNQVILPNNSAYYFKGAVIAGVTGAGDTKGWSIEGVIKRGAGVGTTALVGTPTVTSLYADAGAATWAVTATADTTNGGLKITVTGQASTTIRWVCELDTTEMTY